MTYRPKPPCFSFLCSQNHRTQIFYLFHTPPSLYLYRNLLLSSYMIPRKGNSVLKTIKSFIAIPLKISDLFLTSLPVVKDSFLSAFCHRIIFVPFMCHFISFLLDTALSARPGDPISITGFPIPFLLYGRCPSPFGLW